MKLVAATVRGVAVLDDDGVRTTLENDVRSLVASGGVVYAGTQGDGVFRSDDVGESWQHAGLAGTIVKALAVADDGTVYAGTKPPALFVSHDAGANWRELDALAAMRRWFWWQPAEKPHTPYVDAVAVSPAALLVGIEGGRILRSEDGGETWKRIRRGVAADCHALAFHPHEPGWAYEAAGFGGSFSRDAGTTWTRCVEGLEGRYAMAIGVDPNDPECWYIGTASAFRAHGSDARAALYRRRPGEAWEKLVGGLDHQVRAIVSVGDTVYVGLGNGDILRSPDWRPLPLSFDGLRALVALA